LFKKNKTKNNDMSVKKASAYWLVYNRLDLRLIISISHTLHSPPTLLRKKASADKLVSSLNKCLFIACLLFFEGIYEPRKEAILIVSKSGPRFHYLFRESF